MVDIGFKKNQQIHPEINDRTMKMMLCMMKPRFNREEKKHYASTNKPRFEREEKDYDRAMKIMMYKIMKMMKMMNSNEQGGCIHESAVEK